MRQGHMKIHGLVKAATNGTNGMDFQASLDSCHSWLLLQFGGELLPEQALQARIRAT
jgi:hypothetical protein